MHLGKELRGPCFWDVMIGSCVPSLTQRCNWFRGTTSLRLSSIPSINMLGDITLVIGSCQDTMNNNELKGIGWAFLTSEQLFWWSHLIVTLEAVYKHVFICSQVIKVPIISMISEISASLKSPQEPQHHYSGRKHVCRWVIAAKRVWFCLVNMNIHYQYSANSENHSL